MSKYKQSTILRVVALMLALVFLVPPNVVAAEVSPVEPRASYYLDSYNTYLYNDSFGKIRVYFSVTGVNYMDEIGTLNIQVYESTDKETWTWVAAYNHDSTSGMLGFDKVYHSSYVTYNGTVGRYYKAYVCIWAGKDGDGDTRYMWTQPKKATLFAG